MKIAIIGSGYSGLILANELAKKYKFALIYIIEKNERPGKKLLATGSGRANLGNINLSKEFYSNKFLYEEVIEKNKIDIREYLLKEFNLWTTIENNTLIYPYSFSSKVVLNSIVNKLKSFNNIKFMFNTEVLNIKVTENHKFMVNNLKDLIFDKVVIATGGKSHKELGSDAKMLEFLKSLNEEVEELKPSLVGFRADIKNLKGVRIKALVKLEVDGKIIHEEQGEVQFKSGGISGICVLNCSFYLPKNYHKAVLIIDPLSNFNNLSAINNIDGIFPIEFSKYIKNNKIKDLKNIRFDTLGLFGFEESQVTKGGVKYLVSKKNLGLYFIGEAVDMDAICGGYNLMWALYSAIYIAKII